MKNNSRNTGCLSQKQLMSYLAHELTADETRIVELHLTDCDLCSDALEGLKSLSLHEADRKLAELKVQINKNLLKPKTLAVFPVSWQIAAVIIVLFLSTGSYFFISYFTSHDNKLAVSRESKKNESLSKEINPGQPAETIPPEEKKKSNTVFNNQENKILHPDLQEEKIGSASNENLTSKDELKETPAAAAEYSEKNPSSAERITTDAEEDKFSVTSTGSQLPASVMKAKTSKVSASPDSVKIYIDRRDFTGALLLLQHADNSVQSNYYRGYCYYNTKDYSRASYFFDDVINRSERNQLKEDAMWLKADILLTEGKKEEARTILESLVKDEGSYKTKASALLKSF